MQEATIGSLDRRGKVAFFLLTYPTFLTDVLICSWKMQVKIKGKKYGKYGLHDLFMPFLCTF